MKQHHPILAALLMPLLFGGISSAQSQSSHAEANAEATAEAEASGNQTSITKETVTVTSDGKRTIKKTVRVRNGKEEVITEITDENGTTTTRNGDNQNGQPEDQTDGPWLGIRIKEVSPAMRDQLGLPADQGAVIDLVAPESPAAISGIKKGDLLLSIADSSIGSPEDLTQALAKHKAGDTVTVEIMRRGQRTDIEVTLAERTERAAQDGAPPADNPPADVADGNRKVKIEIDGGAFDSILENPDVPEDFKKTVRGMQKQMEEFQKQHGPK